MYIHIGGDVSLLKKNIIAIFDMDNTTTSKWTRQFLQLSEDDGAVINVSDEIPRTFVIADNGSKTNAIVYLSPVSSATLLKRAEETGIE